VITVYFNRPKAKISTCSNFAETSIHVNQKPNFAHPSYILKPPNKTRNKEISAGVDE